MKIHLPTRQGMAFSALGLCLLGLLLLLVSVSPAASVDLVQPYRQPSAQGSASDVTYAFITATESLYVLNNAWSPSTIYLGSAPTDAVVVSVEITVNYTSATSMAVRYCHDDHTLVYDALSVYPVPMTDYAGTSVNGAWAIFVWDHTISGGGYGSWTIKINYQIPTTPVPTLTPTPTPPGFHTANIAVTQDTFTSANSRSSNYRTQPQLMAGTGRQLLSWLKFDVASANIPADAQIVRAEMVLWYLGQGGNVYLDVFRPITDWVDLNINYNNQPTVETNAYTGRWLPIGTANWFTWDITGLFSQWISGQKPNYGVMVTDHNDNNSAQFASIENTAHHPAYIHVSYIIPTGPTPTFTPTVTPTPQPGTVSITLEPPSATVGVNGVFTVNVTINAGSQPVDSGQAFLNFNPAYLMVVDQSGNPATSIIPGSALNMQLQNEVDNSSGEIDYAAGMLTGQAPSGSFNLASIRFKAKAQTASTTVAFNFTAPRQTKLSFAGNNVLGTTTGGVYAISANNLLSGSILLQGRPVPPSSLLAVPLTVKFYSPGSSNMVMSTSAAADATGSFTVSGVPLGVYDVVVKNSQTLSSKKLNVTFAGGAVVVNFGVLLEGDANNDDIVDISDFSILRTTFLKTCEQNEFDGRADFNGDCIVDISDFSLLRTNFMRSGPIIAAQ